MIGYFPFKEAARLAGFGSYGKHDMIITPEFGPRVRLVTIITDLEIKGQGSRKPVAGPEASKSFVEVAPSASTPARFMR